jgi:hypothetical protein
MITIGTISHGTLRVQDLLRSFAEAYKQYCADEDFFRESLIERANMFADHIDLHPDGDVRNFETADMILEDLMGALNEVAFGLQCYFGAHDGDASDFGFWPIYPIEEFCPEGWEYAETGTEDD